MTLLRTLARLVYHSGRSKVDRRHRLKWTTEFTEATAVMTQSRLDEDELADAIIDLADDCGYTETELAEATYHLSAAGLDEEIPKLLVHVVHLAEFGLCDLSTAARGLAPLMVLFDRDVDEASSVVNGLVHITTKTNLLIPEATRIVEAVGPLARQLDKSFETVVTNVVGVCRQVEAHPPEDYSTGVCAKLKGRYRTELAELRAEE